MKWLNILKIDVDTFVNQTLADSHEERYNTEYPPKVAMRWLLETIEELDYVSISGSVIKIEPSWCVGKNLRITESMYMGRLRKIAIKEAKQFYENRDELNPFSLTDRDDIEYLLEYLNKETEDMDWEDLKSLFTLDYFAIDIQYIKDNPYSEINLYVYFTGIHTTQKYLKSVCISKTDEFPTADSYVNLILLLNNRKQFLSLW